MKRAFLILATVFIGYFQTIAQDSKVTKGVVYFNQEGYEGAIESLNTALENPENLQRKNIPKAYYYRAKSQFKILKQGIPSQKEGEKQNTIDIIAIANDYQMAKINDNGKWSKDIDNELQALRNTLLRTGLTALNAKDYKSAEKYLNKTAEIKEDYVVYDLLGQAKFNTKQYPEAHSHFEKCIDLFQQEKPSKPDLLIGYAYYRLAMIHSYYSGDYDEYYGLYTPSDEDIESAFSYISNGKGVVEIEWGRLQLQKENYTPANWKILEEQYNNAIEDLKRFELDLYLNTPNKLEEALAKFEKTIQENPNDYMMHVAYASLLEKANPEKSILIYEKAIALDNDKEIAHFNLGSVYVNRAVEVAKRVNEELDYDKQDVLYQELGELFKNAKPHLEKALKINPQSLETIRALKQITIQLNLTEEYAKYKQLEAELNK